MLSGADTDPKSANNLISWTDLYDRCQSSALSGVSYIHIVYGIDAVHGLSGGRLYHASLLQQFEGFLISDYAAINEISGTCKQQIQISINAGMDLVMIPHKHEEFISLLRASIDEGAILVSLIDDAVLITYPKPGVMTGQDLEGLGPASPPSVRRFSPPSVQPYQPRLR